MIGKWLRSVRDHPLVSGVRKPDFVIVGTGRCGTNTTADVLSNLGVRCTHERAFTVEGPSWIGTNPLTRRTGDSSWMAVPHLPQESMTIIHQVRHPYAVIRSFHNIGFFHERAYGNQAAHVAYARKHFKFSEDPLRSSLRWYIDWNRRCLELTDMRFQVESLQENIHEVLAWIEASPSTSHDAMVGARNSRAPFVADSIVNVGERLREYPEFDELVRLANFLGYQLEG